jgi:hypothetical protein
MWEAPRLPVWALPGHGSLWQFLAPAGRAWKLAQRPVASSTGKKVSSMIIALTDGTLVPEAFTLTKRQVRPADGY